MSSQAATPSGGTPALTPELFLQHMKAMKAHYQSEAAMPYDLPDHLLLHPSTPGGKETAAKTAVPGARAQMDAILKKTEDGTQALAKRQTEFVNAQSTKLQGSHNTSAFAKAM